jgi:hypothetical protein
MNFIGRKVYMIWKGNILFGTITDTKCDDGDWRYHKIRFSNGEVYYSSMTHDDSGFDQFNNWIRTDKVRRLYQKEMIQMIKEA